MLAFEPHHLLLPFLGPSVRELERESAGLLRAGEDEAFPRGEIADEQNGTELGGLDLEALMLQLGKLLSPSFLTLPTPLLLSCPIGLIQSAHDRCLFQKDPSKTLRLILVEIPVALFVSLDDGDPDLVARDRAEVSTYDESNRSAPRSGADEGVLLLIHDTIMTQASPDDVVGGYPGLRGLVAVVLSRTMRPDELERRLRERLDALGPAPRAELLHVLMLPDFERADRIGEFWGNPKTRTFDELLIDCEEDRTLRAGLLWMLREADRSGPG
jgi:hypothetical protein